MSAMLKAILEQGKYEKFVENITEFDPKTLKEIKKDSLKVVTELRKKLMWRDEKRSDNRLISAELFIFACGTWADAKRVHINHYKESHWHFFEKAILKTKPSWLQKWVEQELTRSEDWEIQLAWHFCRRMMSASLIEKPQIDEYITGMINSLRWTNREESLKSQILKYEDILSEDIWRLFEVENFAFNITNYLEIEDKGWAYSIRELVNDGTIDRQRVLKASLEALHNPFRQDHLREYHSFHESLSPSPEERESLQSLYIGQLSNAVPHVVGFALKALIIVNKSGALNVEEFIAEVPPVFNLSQKTHVKAALRLVKDIGRKHKSMKEELALMLAQGLSHEASDVQEQILKIISTFVKTENSQLAGELNLFRDLVSPSLQSSFSELLTSLGGEEEIEEIVETGPDLENVLAELKELPAKCLQNAGVSGDLSTLDSIILSTPKVNFYETQKLLPELELKPIDCIEELIDRCLHGIERLEDPIELELLFDGMSRLGKSRPERFGEMTAALLKNLSGRRDMASWSDMNDTLRVLVKSWISRSKDSFAPFFYQRTALSEFLCKRAEEVQKNILKRTGYPVLSCPTHSNGYIDPLILVDRVKFWQDEGADIDKINFILALLRLAPENRPEALQECNKLKDGDFKSALIYSLGGGLPEKPKDVSIWIAANRSRNKDGNDPQIKQKLKGMLSKIFNYESNWGPDSFEVPAVSRKISIVKQYWGESKVIKFDLTPGVPMRTPFEHITVRLNKMDKLVYGTAGDQHNFTLIWPANPLPLVRQAIVCIMAQMDSNASSWAEQHGWLKIYDDIDVPFDDEVSLLAAMSLVCKDSNVCQTMTDTVIDAIFDGRVTGEEISCGLNEIYPYGMLKLNRLAAVLNEISQVSLLHKYTSAKILELFIANLEQLPKDIQHLLTLLLELNTELKRPVSETVAGKIQTLKGSSKAAKAAKQLLAIETQDPQTKDAVKLEALQGRIDRAQRNFVR